MKVSETRALVALGALSAWSAAQIVAVRLVASPIVDALAGVLFTVPLISLWEWLVHGFLYHRGLPFLKTVRTIHHAGHHVALFPPARYVQNGTYEFMRLRPLLPFQMSETRTENLLTCWSQVLLHFAVGVPAILVPVWLFTRSSVFLASSLATLSVISWLLAYVHGVIHTPRDRWIERRAWFRWLDRHHYVHHVDMTANLNFLLPLSDFLFGTRKGTLSPAEARRHPRFEDAKPETALSPGAWGWGPTQ